MADEQNHETTIPKAEDLAQGHEPFISATKAARVYRVRYGRILWAVRLGQLTGVEFVLRERGKGLQTLIPVSTMALWAEGYHEKARNQQVQRAEREAAAAAKVVTRTAKRTTRRDLAEHMAKMRAAKTLKQTQLIATVDGGLSDHDQAVEDSLKSLSKKEVYAILSALERLAGVHAERAAKDKG